MKKKIMYLFFTVFLVSIFVGKVNAKDKFVCYYDDKGYLTSPDNSISAYSHEINGIVYYSCDNQKISETDYKITDQTTKMSLSDTVVKMTVNEDWKVTFKFYDIDKNKETSNICFTSDGYNYPGRIKISSDSGKQFSDSDFEFGCPKYIDRLTFSSTTSFYNSETGVTTNSIQTTLLFDKLKSGKDYYNVMYGNSPSESWTSLQSTPCYDETDPVGSAKNVEYCSRIPKKAIPKTVEEYDTDKYISCDYVGTKEAASEGTYAQVSFKFNKEDGKYVNGSGFCEYSVAGGDAKATFDLSISDGKYVCPNEVYDCSDSKDGTSFTNVSCSGGKSYSLVKSFKKTENGGISGCDTFSGLGKYIESAYTLIRYLIPTLIVVLSTADFVGVVFSGEAEKLEKAKNKFINRLIIGVVALLIPFFLELLLKIAGIIGSNESLADVACNWFG